MNNKVIFVISLVIACGLWVYVFISASQEEQATISVTLEDIPDGMMAAIEPNETTVRLSGPQPLVKQAIESMSIKLNAAGLGTGTSTLIVSPKDLEGGGVEVLEISPARFEVTLEQAISRNVPVDAFILDTPALGYKINSVKISPETVTLEGMQRELSQLEKVQTKYISVRNRKNSFSQEVGILEYAQLKSIMPNTVAVDVEIVEDIITRQYTRSVTCAGDKYKLSQEPEISMNLRGRADVMAVIGEEPIAWLDCSTVTKPGTYTVPLVTLPFPKTEVTDVTPLEITIEIIE